jgi:hypothetical protein
MDDPNTDLDYECWDALISIWTKTGRDISFLEVPSTILQQREAMMSITKPTWKKKKFFDGTECGYQNCKNPAEGYIAETTRPTKGGATLWFGPACTPCVRKWHDSLNPLPLAELARQRNGASDLAAVLDVEVGEVLKRLHAAGIDEKGPPRQQELPHTALATTTTALATVENIGIPVQSLTAAYEEARDTLVELGKFEIVNQSQMDFASGLLQEVKVKWARIEADRKSLAKPWQDRVKEVQNYFKPPLDLLAQAEQILKQKIVEGTQRAQAAQQAALVAAQQALQQGNMQGVAVATQAVQASDVVLPKGIGMRGLVRFEIVDPSLLPPVFWSPDPVKVQAAIDAGHRQIPGVKIWEDQSVTARSV